MSGVSRTARWLGCLVVSFGCTTLSLLAADDNKIIFPGGSDKVPAPAGGSGGMVNLFTLVVALILAGVGAWLFLKNRRNAGIVRDGRRLAIEETRSLGNRQYLVVASYDGKKFLLGVCPGRIEMLAPLTDRSSAGDISP